MDFSSKINVDNIFYLGKILSQTQENSGFAFHDNAVIRKFSVEA